MKPVLPRRREFLLAAGGLALFSGLGSAGKLWAAPKFSSWPFKLGVASGDPAADGFVIWTRLAPDPLAEHGGMPMMAVPVLWEVAEDETFAVMVRSGEAVARPELGHSLHVEVVGLKAQRPYWYRFRVVGQDPSPVGRVRTTPAAGTAPTRLRIGVAGCQNWEGGWYTAYRYLAAEPELDAVFHYGDYIYEGRGSKEALPRAGAGSRRHVGDQIYSLDDYRRRYAQYKADPDLQAAHHSAAFLSTWDDHEIDNNWAAVYDQDGTPPEVFALRRFAAMQAWYENMPVRRALFPTSQGLSIHRRIDYGRLLRVHLLDTRQYRTDQFCAGEEDPANCRSRSDAGPTSMLGAEQERWLGQGLDGDVGWHLLAQQVMLMPFKYPSSRAAGDTNLDAWSGYPDARERLVDMIRQRRLGNVVIAAGDVHKHHAGVVPERADDLLSKPIATEFVATSISSGADGSDIPVGWERVLSDNPHTVLTNNRRGYQVFDIGRDTWHTDVVAVDAVSHRDGRKSVIAKLSTERGRPGIERA